MLQKKKIIPKVKKKLRNFLTEESGNITKKDALGLAAAAAIISSGASAMAGHSNGPGGHLSQGHMSGYANGGHSSAVRTAHSSGIVNGHYNRTPSGGHGSSAITAGHVSQGHVSGTLHASHGSHGNHGSGGWC